MLRFAGLPALLLLATASVSFALPSAVVNVPSTDTHIEKAFHLDIDNNVALGEPEKFVNDFSAFGLSYGLGRGLEVGLDVLSGVDHPFFLNAKYAFPLCSRNDAWRMAVGGYAFGIDSEPSLDVWYAVMSYDFGRDRVHAGFFTGNDDLLRNPFTGSDESSGLLLAWDRPLDDKWWVGVDYVAGESTLGALNAGVRYAVSGDSAVLLGVDLWNNDAMATTVNVQYDLQFR